MAWQVRCSFIFIILYIYRILNCAIYTKRKLKYSITDLENPGKKIKGLPEIELQKGANNILLDLKKVPGIKDGNEYLLAVILPDGRKVSLRFKYNEDDE